jgi:kynurenine formamidase
MTTKIEHGISTSALLIALAVFITACQISPDPGPTPTIVDLSHPFDTDTIYWPTEDGFKLDVAAAGMTDAGYYYSANRFTGAEHGGTHLDAPIHFAEGRWTVDQIPLERLIGPAIKVDVSDQCDADRNYEVSVSDFKAWEVEHGIIEPGSIVLVYTGFARHWPNRALYLGTDVLGAEAVAELSFPGLHPDAAQWLIAERGIHAIGLDTASIDRGQSTLFESHRILFDANVPAFENLTQLAQLPPRGFDVFALPMKIGGGSGAPLRAIAVLPTSP